MEHNTRPYKEKWTDFSERKEGIKARIPNPRRLYRSGACNLPARREAELLLLSPPHAPALPPHSVHSRRRAAASQKTHKTVSMKNRSLVPKRLGTNELKDFSPFNQLLMYYTSDFELKKKKTLLCGILRINSGILKLEKLENVL